METETAVVYILLLFIASLFYTSSDALVIYGFSIMGLLTVAVFFLFAMYFEKINIGFIESAFGKWLQSIMFGQKIFWGGLALFFILALRTIFQVILQLIRRAKKIGSTNLNLSNKSMDVLNAFRIVYYVFIFMFLILGFSFTKNGLVDKYAFGKWIQGGLFLGLGCIIGYFLYLSINKEFVKIKNDSMSKPNIVVATKTKQEKKEQLGDTSVIRR